VLSAAWLCARDGARLPLDMAGARGVASLVFPQGFDIFCLADLRVARWTIGFFAVAYWLTLPRWIELGVWTAHRVIASRGTRTYLALFVLKSVAHSAVTGTAAEPLSQSGTHRALDLVLLCYRVAVPPPPPTAPPPPPPP